MPSTYTLISSNVLASSAASVTFSSIPATYTDLVLRCSVRNDYANPFNQLYITLNSDTGANYSYTALRGIPTSVSSFRGTSQTQVRGGYTDATSATANTYSSNEIYIPSYTSTSNKPISVFGAQEDNVVGAYMEINANLWQSSSAITTISIATQGTYNFLSTSSFWLYGIKNS